MIEKKKQNKINTLSTGIPLIMCVCVFFLSSRDSYMIFMEIWDVIMKHWKTKILKWNRISREKEKVKGAGRYSNDYFQDDEIRKYKLWSIPQLIMIGHLNDTFNLFCLSDLIHTNFEIFIDSFKTMLFFLVSIHESLDSFFFLVSNKRVIDKTQVATVNVA